MMDRQKYERGEALEEQQLVNNQRKLRTSVPMENSITLLQIKGA